jgi:hypothetical protein
MTFKLTWLPDVLKSAGLKVATEKGWETRGRGDVGEILGVMCHHTGTPNPKKLNMPTLEGLVKGVTQADGNFLEGPLAQLALGRDGTFYVIAAGRANHAGPGEWQGIKTGNLSFIGIEAENAGTKKDFRWPEVQMDAYRRGVAALLKKIEKGASFCCGHKEYRLPLGEKDDPSFDMNVFRAGVDAILKGTASLPVLIPPSEPSGPSRLTLRRGMQDPLAVVIQRKLHVVPQSETFGPKTEAAVREFQRNLNMVPDGIVGPKTWVELDKLP